MGMSSIRTFFKNINDNCPIQPVTRSSEASSVKLVLVAPPSPYSPHYARLSHPPYSLVSVFDVNPLIPLGPAYVAAAVEAAGFQVEVIDLTFQSQQKLNLNRIHRMILDLTPDIVGFSSFTSTIPTVYQLASLLKKSHPSLPLIIGGSHASALPIRTLTECPSLDAAIIGEGEAILPGFLTQLIEYGLSDELARLSGVIFRSTEGSIIGNSKPVYVENLDAICRPARHLFDLERYKQASSQVPTAKQHPIASIITSRGCPHGCRFCFHSGGWQYRARSPLNVVEEIEYLSNLGFREIQVFDDNFTQNRNRVLEICRLIREKRLEMSFCLPNGVRVDAIDEELLRMMFAVGFYSIHFGVESGDEAMLKSVGKGVSVEQVQAAVRLAKQVGFRVSLYLIVGLPGSTTASMEKSFELVKASGTDYVTAFLFTPYPGSSYWRLLEDQLAEIPWERYNDGDSSNPIYVPEGMTSTQLQYWCSEINKLAEV
jgi:radical SAM superfamily enzyme YgiQ (UPF0313 family)